MWIALLGIALHFGLSLMWPYRPSAPLFLSGVALCFAFLALSYRRLRSGRLSFRWLLLTALLLRLVWLAQPPGLSEDAYRYLWDGMLSAQGINPYPQPPQQLTQVQQQHPDLYSKMAHVDRTSIYPPAAQFFFWANHLLWGTSLTGWKIWLLLSEMLLLRFWWRSGRLESHKLALWLLNPLAVIEFYSSGHLDLLGICLLTGALVLTEGSKGRKLARQAGQAMLLSLASLIKIFPALLAPLLIKQQGSLVGALRFVILYGLGLALPSAAFLALQGLPAASWNSFLGILDTFRGIWRFNSLPFLALQEHHETLRPWAERMVIFGTLAIVLGPALWRLLRRRDRLAWKDWLHHDLQPASLPSLATSCYFILMLLYLCSHTMHPWYVSWCLLVYPILGMRYWAGLYLSAASFLSYLAYWFEPSGERIWVLWVEYLPFYLLLLRDVVRAVGGPRKGANISANSRESF